jgi:hypothetical protein
VYPTCAFCDAPFGGDGGPSGLGVGRRFAFDEWKARLWVVCRRCSRWNLSPLDDRLERIEALARLVPEGHVLASTDHVSLVRWRQYDLVRVGKPPRAELATWRYGERLRARARDRAKIVIPLTVVALGLGVAANVAAGGSLGILVWNLHGLADAAYMRIVGRRRVHLAEPPTCTRCGALMELRAHHVRHARLVAERRTDMALLVSCPHCHREGSLLTGDSAARALRQGLTYLNATRSGRRRAEAAARALDQTGGPEDLVRDVAQRALSVGVLPGERRLALEMALDDRQEARELERQWREAEDVAEIADGLLSTTRDLEEQLRRLREQNRSQPNG